MTEIEGFARGKSVQEITEGVYLFLESRRDCCVERSRRADFSPSARLENLHEVEVYSRLLAFMKEEYGVGYGR